MKVLFIQNFLQPYLGVMSISAMLKKAGHSVDVHIVDDERTIVEVVRRAAPDIVAFSCTTAMYPIELRQARAIREAMCTPVIFGGVHPTICPEIIHEPCIDYICRGEGEYAFLELLDALGGKGDVTRIKNIWARQGTRVYENEMRPLIEDLDELPPPDRGLYYLKFEYLRTQPTKTFLVGRGCPYRCSFCINATYMRLYRGKGAYVRRRSIPRIIEEIVQVRNSFGLSHIYFNDDTFTLNKEWLFAFLDAYKELRIPFTCGSRASLITEEMVTKLLEARCYCIEIGVETGEEEFRKGLLGKDENNETYLRAASLIHAHGIKLKTSNMICLPGETVERALETVRFNRALRADFMNCSLLQPYPLLDITVYAQQHGYLDPDFDFSTLAGLSYFRTPLKLHNKKRLMNIQKFFYIGVWFPFTIPIIRLLSLLPPNPLFKGIFNICYVYSYARYHQLSLWSVLKLAIHSRRLM